MISKARLINLPKVDDPRGSLTFVEGNNHIPFKMERVFYLYNVPKSQNRGGHAHRQLHQFISAVAGRFEVFLDNGCEQCSVLLDRPNCGLHVEPLVWVRLENFSPGAVCCVLASAPYEEADYIRSYKEFLKAVRGGHSC